MKHFSFYFLPSKPPICPSHYISNSWPLLSLVASACTSVCGYTDRSPNMALIFLNTLNLSNVTCMYVFKADHSALDSQLVRSSLERHLSCFQLSLVALQSFVRLRPHGLFLLHFSMSTEVVLVQLTFGQSC